MAETLKERTKRIQNYLKYFRDTKYHHAIIIGFISLIGLTLADATADKAVTVTIGIKHNSLT